MKNHERRESRNRANNHLLNNSRNARRNRRTVGTELSDIVVTLRRHLKTNTKLIKEQAAEWKSQARRLRERTDRDNINKRDYTIVKCRSRMDSGTGYYHAGVRLTLLTTSLTQGASRMLGSKGCFDLLLASSPDVV